MKTRKSDLTHSVASNPASFLVAGTLNLALATLSSIWLSPYMSIATFAYFSICIGYLYRKSNVRMHGIFMGAGIVVDLALVLTLELQRNAIKTAVSHEPNFFQHVHIVFSSLAVVLYIPLLIMGLAFATKPTLRKRFAPLHGNLGRAAFLFRTVGFIFMFSMVSRIH